MIRAVRNAKSAAARFALLEQHQKSHQLFQELGLKQSIATCLLNIGVVHQNKSQYSQKLIFIIKEMLVIFHLEALKILIVSVPQCLNKYLLL